jgi:hypothetical protein
MTKIMAANVQLKDDIATILQRNQKQHQQQVIEQDRKAAEAEEQRKRLQQEAADLEENKKTKVSFFGRKATNDTPSSNVLELEETAPDPIAGTYIKATGAKPQLSDHNRAIAEAAAVQFKKKEKDIQKAVRQLDGEPEPANKESACCVIL